MAKTLFNDLLTVLKTYRKTFLKGFILVLISNGLLILNPLVFRQAVLAVDPLSPAEGGALNRIFQSLLGEKESNVWSWVPYLFGIALTSAVFKYWMRMTFLKVSRAVETNVRFKLFEKIQQQSMAFFDRFGTGELLSRLTNDITAYRDVLGPGIMYPLFFLTIVIPGLFALFIISPPLTLISLIPLFLIPIVNLFFKESIYRAAADVQAALGKLSGRVQEQYSGIRMVKSFSVEQQGIDNIQDLSETLRKKNFFFSILQGALFPFFTLLTKMTTVIFVLATGLIVLQGWEMLSAADFISFMWIQSYIFFPVLMLGWLLPVYERGRAAYDRLLEIYEEPIEVKETADSPLRIPQLADISIKNLTFTYPKGEKPALANISLKIRGGSFVGLTGPIGGGKTTLFKLLSREYEVLPNTIEINGVDIHLYPLNSFYSAIVSVEQVPFLFSKTIIENVRFGRPEATDTEVINVSQFADLHETVLEFPNQYETIVGERGMTLSGGQKQRVAMARAFLVNRTILLLDDIFSAVDAATEERIFRAMHENFRGKTVLLITHRVSVLEKMDQILYIDRGRLLERGTHQELMRNQGHYAALVELQSL